MTPEQLVSRLGQGPMLLDGGVGTLLISMGLEPGQAPERWLLEHPERVTLAHKRYAEAGSDAVHTVTFGRHPYQARGVGVGWHV